MTRYPARKYPYSIFTHSVGANVAGHSLLAKLRAVADAGFDGIELFQDDLDAFAQSEEFRQIQQQNDLLVVHQQQLLSLTPPESPMNFSRRMSGSSELSDSSSSTSASTSAQESNAKGKFQPFANEDDLLVRDARGELVIGLDGLPMTYNAFGACTATTYRQEMAAALYLSSYCETLGLRIYSLQPLRDFEGWADEKDQELALKRARSRFDIMRALGADLLLICSNNQKSPATTGDLSKIGRDLAALGQYAEAFGPIMALTGREEGYPIRSSVPIRIGFEALSWGAHVDVWSRAWDAVRLADRHNVGLILDSFNTLGREYADPCSPTGIQTAPETYTNLMASLDQLTQVPADKIFFLQIGDARKMEQPLEPSPNEHEPRPARMIWSRGNRLFPCEFDRGAFLPVKEFVYHAVVAAGYQGPWSIEVFNSSLNEENDAVPSTHARRARTGLDRLVEQVHA
ncbi:xylose isomerase-like protein [Testicularia cyperi]|uniref:Xylose isomerase-like protein n=1 Tax=Testicularia cyperi TaxID=1882483 RepID=A0A317XXK2_9BASI|nr:xylose isomerase-like protein [Testicularia cyperi]